jgi:hypothetical protein
VEILSENKEEDWGENKSSPHVVKEKLPSDWGTTEKVDLKASREKEERDHKRFLRISELWVLGIFVFFSLTTMIISAGSVSETKEIILASLSIFTLVLGIDKGKRD